MFTCGKLALRHLQRVAQHTCCEPIGITGLVQRIEFRQRLSAERLHRLVASRAEVGHEVIAAGDAEPRSKARVEFSKSIDIGIRKCKDG